MIFFSKIVSKLPLSHVGRFIFYYNPFCMPRLKVWVMSSVLFIGLSINFEVANGEEIRHIPSGSCNGLPYFYHR